MIKAWEAESGEKKNPKKWEQHCCFEGLVSAVFVLCQKAFMEQRWLGSVCDLLPYLRRFYGQACTHIHFVVILSEWVNKLESMRMSVGSTEWIGELLIEEMKLVSDQMSEWIS